jgi:hypothetical protein
MSTPQRVSQRVDDLVGPVARGLPVPERQGIRVADPELAVRPARPRQRDHLIADVDSHHPYAADRQLGDGPPGTAAGVDHERALGGTQQLVRAGPQRAGASSALWAGYPEDATSQDIPLPAHQKGHRLSAGS